jgi:hypothetical protein
MWGLVLQRRSPVFQYLFALYQFTELHQSFMTYERALTLIRAIQQDSKAVVDSGDTSTEESSGILWRRCACGLSYSCTLLLQHTKRLSAFFAPTQQDNEVELRALTEQVRLPFDHPAMSHL